MICTYEFGLRKARLLLSLFFFSLILLSSTTLSPLHVSFGAYVKAPVAPNGPTINDPNLTVEKYIDTRLKNPTSMAFIGNDILVLEKNTGNVIRIVDGQVQKKPVLQVPVATAIERGLLGIAVSKNNGDGKTYVFLFYTESGGGKSGDDVSSNTDPKGNRLYRYEYENGQLINPQLLLDLNAIPVTGRGEHNGGKVLVGPDNNVYLIVGEVGGHRTQAQNIENGGPPDGTGGVLRITQDGDVVPGTPIFGDKLPLSLYYAIGLRNSFGMDFDPVTGNLWDSENGPTSGDKIDLVKPGFNSGWALIDGYSYNNLLNTGAKVDDLVTIGNSKFYEPKFVWDITIGPTALKFLNSDKLGQKYKNNLFLGDINNGNLYRFTLDEKRENIVFDNTYGSNINVIKDNEIRNTSDNIPIIFGQGFGGITDLQVGPDGYLYVLTYPGDIYKILPASHSHTVQKHSQSNSDTTAADTAQQSDNSGPSNSAPVAIVGIKGKQSYSPNPIEINAGQTITWYNGDAIAHTVTSGSPGKSGKDNLFDSGAILANQRYSLIFDEPGTYYYHCTYHPSMVGTIEVK